MSSVAEIKFCKLYATGEMSNQDCAKQAGIATGTEQGTAARVRRLLRDPRLRREIDRFRRANMQAARVDSTTLAYDFSQRVRADPCNIHHPETGKLLPMNQWPKVLRRMVRKFHYDKEGNVKNVEFATTSHLDNILATYTGMIGDRLPADTTTPLTTVIVIERNGPGAPEPLPLPSMEEILEGEIFDGDDLGPLLMNIKLPDEGEEPPWTPPPETETERDATVEDDLNDGRKLDDMRW